MDPSSRTAKPNIVVILADDMGWGDVGCYGSTKIPTPNMDRLAAEGARLTNVHSASSVCTPSRYALMTGRYAWRGVLKRGVLRGHSPAIIEPGRTTIASMLREQGYGTAAIGKWHLGLGWRRRDGSVRNAFETGPEPLVTHSDSAPAERPEVRDDYGYEIDYSSPFVGGPLDYGFDRFFGIAGTLNTPPYCFLDQDRTLGIPNREKEIYYVSQRPGLQTPGWRDDEVDVRFAQEACHWIRRQDENKPFFLYVATSSPHIPCVPPEFARGRSEAGTRGDAVWMVDWVVGQVMEVLDDRGLADDTLVIVTSDNGAIYGEWGSPETYGHASNGPWRGQKADIWDGGHREPFVARWPRSIPAGRVSDAPVCLTDLLPTFAEVSGAGKSYEVEDGLNALGVLTGLGSIDPHRTMIHHSGNGTFAIRRDEWKAVLGSGSGGFSVPIGASTRSEGQLYNLVDDPGETRNLWHELPEIVAALIGELQPREEDGIP